MALNINSNIGASIALRALGQSDRAMTASLSKLSSGSRVQSAKDDAASLAIGSRLQAEISALKTVSSNATQGISMLQIAEGAYARTADMVTRMRALSSQAASSHLSSTERAMLNTEFQAVKAEINRIAASTSFNGSQLLNSTFNYTWDTDYVVLPPGMISDLTIYNTDSNTGFDWYFSNYYDGTFYFIDPITNKNYTIETSNQYFNPTTLVFSERATIAINQLVFNSSGLVSERVPVGSITFNAGADLNLIDTISSYNIFRVTSASYSSQTYRISTGTTNSSITANIFGINATNLGLSSASLTTKANAEAASEAARFAMDMIAKARSELAAAQNRMEAAQKNNANTVENLESARSAYMDLDVASEMSVFTSKKILVQAGISMIAQAGRMPRNLLRLFG